MEKKVYIEKMKKMYGIQEPPELEKEEKVEESKESEIDAY